MFSRLTKTKQKLNHKQIQNMSQHSLSLDLNENLEALQSIYKDCPDVVFRSFCLSNGVQVYLIYIDGLSNIEELDSNVLSPLMEESTEDIHDLHEVMKRKLSVSQVTTVHTIENCSEQISDGHPILLIEGENNGFALGLAEWEKRSIDEPASESVVRGPREGFTETLTVNTSLIRRKIKNPQLKMTPMKIGEMTKTKIIIAYIKGIVDETLITEVTNRIEKINIDGVLESEFVEEMIEDNPFSPFPQVLVTERPDVSASHLLEGRVVILVDGTPFALIAPTTLYSLLQSAEDHYTRFIFGSAIRLLRYLFFVIALFLPAIYVSVLSYHQEMVPTQLLLSFAASREGIPFPALIEALIMEITFEGLREAGIRLPKQIGAAISIVGALVIGQAAIQAGLTSAPMVMVVALTGIASFTIPNYSLGFAVRLLRFPITILGGLLGFLGVMFGLLFIITHLCTLRSFGVPYLTPMAPMSGKEIKDVLVRAPRWMLNTRPHLTGQYNKYRQAPHQKPDPRRGGE